MNFTRYIRLLFIGFLFLFYNGELSAQSPLMWQLTDEDGLPSMSVNSIKQDAKGYIWIATSNGLCRYDGRNIKQFDHSKLSGLEIMEIIQDPKGGINFLNLEGEIGYIKDSQLKKFSLTFSNVYTKRQEFKSTQRHEFKWINNRLWTSQNDVGIIEFEQINKDSFQISSIGGSGDAIINLKGKKYLISRTINKDSEHVGKIYEINDEEKNIDQNIEFKTEKFIYSSLQVDSIRAVITSQKELFLLNIKNKECSNLIPENFEETINDVYCFKQMIFFSTNRGVYKINIFDKKIKTIVQRNNVRAVFIDENNNLWLGTNSEGVLIIPNQENIIFTKSNSPITSNSINSLYAIPEYNQLLIGQNGGKVSLMDLGSYKMQSFQVKNAGRITGFFNTQNNHHFYVSSDNKYFKIQISATTLQLSQISTFQKCVKTTYLDHKQNFWIGTCGPLMKYPNTKVSRFFTKNIISTLDTFSVSPSPLRVYAINEDSQQRIWVGSSKGLYQYTDSLRPFLEDGVHQTYSAQCMVRLNDTLWVGTKGHGLLGIYNNEIVNRYTLQNGLASNNCLSLCTKSNQTLWVGTDKGLHQLDFVNQKINRIDQFDGLSSSEICAIQVLNDNVWIGTPKGLVKMKIKELKPNNTKPPIYLTGIQILDRDTSIHTNYQLDYTQNDFKIDYTGLAYRAQGKETYEYRLLGQDTNWITTSSRTVRFRDLPPGDYNFEVVALNEDKIKSRTPANFSFQISPPWWETIWFYIACIIAGAGLLSLFFIRRINRLKKEQELNQKFNALRTQALQAQMNPHFVFNALNAIQKFMTTNDTEPAMKYLTQFAKLIRMIFDMSKEQWVSLERELNFLQLYINLEKLRFQNKVNVIIGISPSLQSEMDILYLPPLLIQPIIENAFKHGLLHKLEGGELKIEFSRKKELLIVTIQDNGVGRKKSGEINQWKKGHKSSGMNTTKERLQLIVAESEVTHDTLEVLDLYDELGVPSGTLITMRIPLIYKNES